MADIEFGNDEEAHDELPQVVKFTERKSMFMKQVLKSKSLVAARDHVFLTWHDLNFSVPILKKAPESTIPHISLKDTTTVTSSIQG